MSNIALGAYIDAIVEHGKAQGSFSFSIALDEHGAYTTVFNAGSASSLGLSDTLTGALKQIVVECRL